MVRLLAAPEGRLVADPHVLFALRRMYGELLGRAGSDADVAHVAAVLLLFNPDEDAAAIAPIRPYVIRSGKSPRGAVWMRGALDVLRTANAPLTASELAALVIAARGIPYSRALHRNATASLLTGLKAKPGVVCHHGRPRRWGLR